jgi:hypothetical protein
MMLALWTPTFSTSGAEILTSIPGIPESTPPGTSASGRNSAFETGGGCWQLPRVPTIWPMRVIALTKSLASIGGTVHPGVRIVVCRSQSRPKTRPVWHRAVERRSGAAFSNFPRPSMAKNDVVDGVCYLSNRSEDAATAMKMRRASKSLPKFETFASSSSALNGARVREIASQ